MCSGAAKNLAELVATRVFLGIFKATFGAGAPPFLSCIYKRRELGLRVSVLLGMSPLAIASASSLAYRITHIKESLEPWRLLFVMGIIDPATGNKTNKFLEGAPTILFAPVVYFFLIDSPATAKFLTDEERNFAARHLQVRED